MGQNQNNNKHIKEVSLKDLQAAGIGTQKHKQSEAKNESVNMIEKQFKGMDSAVEEAKKENEKYQQQRQEYMLENGLSEKDVISSVTPEKKEDQASVQPKKEFHFADDDNTEIESSISENNYTEPKKEIRIADELNKVSDPEDNIEDEISSPLNLQPTTHLIDLDPKDFDDDEDEDSEQKQKEAKEQLSILQKTIKQKIAPINNKIDIKSFTIAKDPTTTVNALKMQNASLGTRTEDWVCIASNRSISMKEFKGFSIEKLNPRGKSGNRFNMYRERFYEIYSHLEGIGNLTFEEWLRSTSFFDIPHIYFDVVKSAFGENFYVPYTCTDEKCRHPFLKQVNVEDMVKYKNDEVREAARKLLNTPTTKDSYKLHLELVQMSDVYAFALRDPSIYNIIFENAILDEDFTSKYRDVLNYLSYVDSIYVIDTQTQSLKPIAMKLVPGKDDDVKVIKEKIRKYYEIIKSLTSDQLYLFTSYIEAISRKYEDLITYVIPEAECPKCHHKIEEAPDTPENILFTRHQLTGLAVLPTE